MNKKLLSVPFLFWSGLFIIIPLIIEIVGYFLMTIPFIFWDYDSSKQDKVMHVLQRRAEVTEKAMVNEESPVMAEAGKVD